MRKIMPLKSFLAAVAAGSIVGVMSCRADDEQLNENGAETAEKQAEIVADSSNSVLPFTSLMRCKIAKGLVQVKVPGSDWQNVREGKYYPLGSSFRTVATESMTAPEAEIAFGPVSTVTMKGVAGISTKAIEIGELPREMVIDYGEIAINLPRTLKDGLFVVKTPSFKVFNMAGESSFSRTLDAAGDGDESVVRVVTGGASLDGRHYKIERLGAANQIRIRTTADELFTSLRGESGDYMLKLEQGVVEQIKDFETGEKTSTDLTLDFQMSPQCSIKIWRQKAEIGGRIVVSTMTFNANGDLVNRRVFAEKRTEVNSGELVIAPETESETEKKVKDAETENTETVEADDTETETSDDTTTTEEE